MRTNGGPAEFQGNGEIEISLRGDARTTDGPYCICWICSAVHVCQPRMPVQITQQSGEVVTCLNGSRHTTQKWSKDDISPESKKNDPRIVSENHAMYYCPPKRPSGFGPRRPVCKCAKGNRARIAICRLRVRILKKVAAFMPNLFNIMNLSP